MGKGGACQGRCLGAGDGHVEDGQVEKADLLVVALDKGQGLPGLYDGFRRGAEQQIDLGGDTGPVQGSKHLLHQDQINPLVEPIQDLLRTGFQAEFK